MKGNVKKREGPPRILKSVPLDKEKDLKRLDVFQHQLITKANSILRCGASSKEVVIGVYLKLWQMKIPKYRNILDLYSYTCTMIKRDAWRYAKQRKKHANQLEKLSASSQRIEESRQLSRRELKRIIKELPSILTKKEFTIIYLWLHGTSYNEIAEEMKISKGSARGILTRTKKKIKQVYYK
ncbi:MAG: RNA polymerase sigma factor [Saprospiraceae bacterium]